MYVPSCPELQLWYKLHWDKVPTDTKTCVLHQTGLNFALPLAPPINVDCGTEFGKTCYYPATYNIEWCTGRPVLKGEKNGNWDFFIFSTGNWDFHVFYHWEWDFVNATGNGK